MDDTVKPVQIKWDVGDTLQGCGCMILVALLIGGPTLLAIINALKGN